MSDQWHLLNNGQQYGPYSEDDLLQFVREGRIVRDSLLWTEGMQGWVAASTLEGLFPQVVPAIPLAIAVPQAPAIPRPVASGTLTAPTPQRATSPGKAATQRTAPAGKASTQRGQTTKQSTRAMPSGPYPTLRIKPASFELLLALLGSVVTLMAIAIWAQRTIDQSDVAAQATQTLWLKLMWAAAAGCLIGWIAVNAIYLHRIWLTLQYAKPRTTPGNAVGLLLVPLFNLYWTFVAFYGLAQDWNRITARYPDLNRAPKLNEGLFLAFCCCSILVPPVAMILWFPVMLQICQAISFMALPPRHRASLSRSK